MPGKVAAVVEVVRSDLLRDQRRLVVVFGWVAVVLIVGLTFTGVWQVFVHESDPSWFEFSAESTARPTPTKSTGLAALHGFLADVSTIFALIGGAAFAYKVAYTVPASVVFGLVVAVFGVFSGSLIQFNLIKLRGKPYEEAGSGYAQVFSEDFEYMVTDKHELGALAARIWVGAHVLTIPLLLVAAWLALSRVAARRTRSRSRGEHWLLREDG
ncbi:MAG: NAD(P)(+) transhydrogenase (Re/Si-specific) subunit beta [Actinomycetia bacterium]|nr:NAD(P)(+) transhydrogenase (Re/Si-specific) subunit beta [Actinomycetes bacterium]MCP4959463.1 NAD(P)(+) transhydrogenase (Re/Si-specific) subunit beta [Actinomycetes bacterium]